MSSGIQIDAKTRLKEVRGWVLLVKQDPIERESPGGIAFSEQTIAQAEMAQTKGVVLSIGEFALKDEPEPRCGIGDHVIFRQYAGQFLDIKGPDKYRVINDKDVYGVLEPISEQKAP